MAQLALVADFERGAQGRGADGAAGTLNRMTWRRLGGQAAWRLAVWAGVLALSGLLAATLVRMAPGFGTDERLLDPRLAAESRVAIAGERQEQSNVIGYYADYLRRLARGDLGESVSLRRPVRELLGERLPVSVRSGLAGLGMAWGVVVAAVAVLELAKNRWMERASALVSGGLLCVPAALAALACIYLRWTAAGAIATILLPRIFRYARQVADTAGRAPHILAAHAVGIGRGRVLAYHVIAPAWPELAALAGISVSMAAGAVIPVEAVCDSPGVGQLVWQAALSRDLPVLVNVTLLITAVTTGANLLADWARSARKV